MIAWRASTGSQTPPLCTPNRQSTVQQLQPLQDPRWDEFVSRAQNSSVFHTRAWLEALRRTYGYEPVVYTTSPANGALENGLLFCRVKSWFTGDRLVSVPFADHCDPLARDSEEILRLVSAVERDVLQNRMDYLELRPRCPLRVEISLSNSEYVYCFHQLDLSRDLDTVFHSFHKDSTQRKIKRAQREGLDYEEGRSDPLLDAFYPLLVLTRQRRQVPPQPKRWFQNLMACMGDRLKVRVASIHGRPIAAIVTLRHKDTLVYKYGGSDARFHNLGAMHLLFWKCIQEAKQEGVRVFDLGRSNVGDGGLITFKDRWGGERSTLTYSRHGRPGRFEYRPDGNWTERLAKQAAAHLPRPLFVYVGELLYPHLG